MLGEAASAELFFTSLLSFFGPFYLLESFLFSFLLLLVEQFHLGLIW